MSRFVPPARVLLLALVVVLLQHAVVVVLAMAAERETSMSDGEASTDMGVLNVVEPPWNIDNTGRTDVTAALQAAIKHAHDSFMVVYFPHGVYLVSAPLTAYDNTTCHGYSCDTNNTWPNRFQPNVFLGARALWNSTSVQSSPNPCAQQYGGVVELPIRPTILLAPHAANFSDVNKPMPIVDFTMTLDPTHPAQISGINFNQLFRGIDVCVSPGNPGAIGVQLPGAQGSSVQDSTIWVGDGYSGICGGAGAGGSHEMVTVIGGLYGLDYTVSLNAPAMTGMTLINQSKAAILYVGLEAGSVVGARIALSSYAAYALLSTQSDTMWGQVSVVDSVVDYSAAAAVAADNDGERGSSDGCVAFRSVHSLYLENVWVSHCGTVADMAPIINTSFDGNTKGWTVVHQFAGSAPIHGSPTCKPASMPIYVDGVRISTSYLSNITNNLPPDVLPPVNITSQHHWDEATVSTFDQQHITDVRTYGAVGDGDTDDTDAIQKAIDSTTVGGTVLLPRGFYRISRTLNITGAGATTLMGIARHLSILMPLSKGLTGMQMQPAPILHMTNSDVQVTVQMLSIVTWEHLDNVYAMQWDNHHHESMYRQNYFYRTTECLYGFPHPLPVPRPTTDPTMPCAPSANLTHPLNVITGSIKAYNYENEDFLYENPAYRHMLVVGNTASDRIRFYEANFEHTASEANLEIRDACNVIIYSFKTEGLWGAGTRGYWWDHNPDVSVWINNSTHVHIFSHGGNARPMATGSAYPAGYASYPPSLYRIVDSCDVRLTNLVDQFQFAPDNNWNFVYEQAGQPTHTSHPDGAVPNEEEDKREGQRRSSGAVVLTGHCERPVLYERSPCAQK